MVVSKGATMNESSPHETKHRLSMKDDEAYTNNGTPVEASKMDVAPSSAKGFTFSSFRSLLGRRNPEESGSAGCTSSFPAASTSLSSPTVDAMPPPQTLVEVLSLAASEEDRDDAVRDVITPSSTVYCRVQRNGSDRAGPRSSPRQSSANWKAQRHRPAESHTHFVFDSREHSTQHMPDSAPRVLCLDERQRGCVADVASPSGCAYVMGEFPRRNGLTEAQYRSLMERHQRLADVATLVARCRRIASMTSLDSTTPPQQRNTAADEPGKQDAPCAASSDHALGSAGGGGCSRIRVPSPPPPVSLSVDIDAEESTGSSLGRTQVRWSARGTPETAAVPTGAPPLTSPVPPARSTVCDPYAFFLYHCAMVQQRIALLETLTAGLDEDHARAQKRCRVALSHTLTHRSDKSARERLDALHGLLCLWRNRANTKVVAAAVYAEAVECLSGLPLVTPLLTAEAAAAAASPQLSFSASSRASRRRPAAVRVCVSDVVHTPWVTPSQRAARSVFLADPLLLGSAQHDHVRALVARIRVASTQQISASQRVEQFMTESCAKLFRGNSLTKASRGKTATPVSWRRRLLEESGDDAVTTLLLEQLFLFNTEATADTPDSASLPVHASFLAASPLLLSPDSHTAGASAFPPPVSPLKLLSAPMHSALKKSGSSSPSATRKPERHVSFKLDQIPTLAASEATATTFCARAHGHVEQLMTWMASLRSTVMQSDRDVLMRLEHVEQVHYFKLNQTCGGFGRPVTSATSNLFSPGAERAQSCESVQSLMNSPSLQVKSSPDSSRSENQTRAAGAKFGARASRKEQASSGCGDPADCAVM